MRENFERCLNEVLAHEGGWADHPKDPGGATMKGVTIGTFAQFKGRKVTKDELRAISDVDLRTIYRRKYWDLVRGDDLPAGLDLVAFDAAVNSGPARGARWLQQAVGVTADGKVGPATVAAAQAQAGASAIERAIAIRLSFLRGLKTWPTFGKGWQRRVNEVRAVALDMANSGKVAPTRPTIAPPPPADTPKAKPKFGMGQMIAVAVAGVLLAASQAWEAIRAALGF